MKNLERVSDLNEFASIAESLRSQHVDDNSDWTDSPFAWIRSLPSRKKGAVGEQIISLWCESYGFDVAPSNNIESDRTIGNLRIEIKFSTLWANGSYMFQQLRDQNYDVVICLGLSPHDVHCWVLSKNLIMEKWKSGEIKSQHKGSEGTDTAWFRVDPSDPLEWLTPRNGRPADAIETLRQFIESK